MLIFYVGALQPLLTTKNLANVYEKMISNVANSYPFIYLFMERKKLYYTCIIVIQYVNRTTDKLS